MGDDAMRVDVIEDGPYFVSGGVPLLRAEIVTNEAGESVAWRETETVEAGDAYPLCRCGSSGSKPFCDGTHAAVGFDGAETAADDPFFQRSACIDGQGVKLRDARDLCAEARFCDRGGGLWNLVHEAGDPEVRVLVEDEVEMCPSGRYVLCEEDGVTPVETGHEASIVLVDDPSLEVSGPLWVRGGIPVHRADGTPYEVRDRVTLCRCGRSGNKPFCDGSHIEVGFREEG